MSHFLNKAFESAFAVHGFLEKNSTDSGHSHSELVCNYGCRFFGAFNSRVRGLLISTAVGLPDQSSNDSKWNLTGNEPEDFPRHFKFCNETRSPKRRKVLETLSKPKTRAVWRIGVFFRSEKIPSNRAYFLNQIAISVGLSGRRLQVEAPLIPPRFSCERPDDMPTNFRRSDFKSNSRRPNTCANGYRKPSRWLSSRADFFKSQSLPMRPNQNAPHAS